MVEMDIAERKLKEQFARFLEAPTREGLRDRLANSLGEFDHYELKEEWPGPVKLARHILGLANSGGGVIIVGVKDGTSEPLGLDKLMPKEQVYKSVDKFLPPSLQTAFPILDFRFAESEYAALKGKQFQVVVVHDDPRHLPFVCMADGEKGGEKLRKAAIFVRRGTMTVEADYEELQDLINRRIETGHSSRPENNLVAGLEQLRILYGQIERYTYWTVLDFEKLLARPERLSLFGAQKESNPDYPEESFDRFVARLIASKKRQIEHTLGVSENLAEGAGRIQGS